MKSTDWQETLLSQYSNSPIIMALIKTFDAAMDPQQNIDDWYAAVWNVLTARGWGLDVWGRIVGVTRYLLVEDDLFLGFANGNDPVYQPFGQGPFWMGTPASSNYALTDDAFRLLILTKALANITRASAPNYNRMLMMLFPDRGNAYSQDFGEMLMGLVFEFSLTPVEAAIITQSGAISAPTGVGMRIISVPIPGTFGFHTPGYTDRYAPFGQGTFFAGAL